MTKDTKQLFRLIGTTGAVYLVFRYLLPLVVPFLFAVLMVKLLAPAVDWCYNRLRLPKRFVSLFLLILTLFGVGLFVGTTVIACVKQFSLLVRNLPRYQNLWYDTTENICCRMDGMFGLANGVSMGFIETNMTRIGTMLNENITPRLAGYTKDFLFSVFGLGMTVFIFIIATMMIMGNREGIKEELGGNFLYRRLQPVLQKIKGTGFSYLKAQGIIIFIVSCICVLGLFLIGNPYAVLFGIGIGIFDAFPVVGSGSILIPWAIFHILNGDMKSAAILVTVYVVALIIREVLEPKLLGNCLGVQPLYMLMSIFIGVKVFGVGGIILGPVGLITIRHLLEEGKEGNVEENT